FRPDGPDPATCAETERLLGLILPELDMELKAASYVCGAQPTLADIAIFTSVEYLHAAGFALDGLDALACWFERCAARPAWAGSSLAALPG
ncbi:glutathione S-transferase family protein, partial [Immundisolibacter sp.]|uniref:glutathione S-transferase family protein n=1 Tax=Immundisolibacter sp. TaxID=1934948 RepID=UPI003568948B